MEDEEEFIKNDKLLLKRQQIFKSERYKWVYKRN